MRLSVKVCARSRRDVVEGPLSDGSWKVHTRMPPVDGAANDAVIALLAEYWHKPKSAIQILQGHTSTRKLVEISGETT
ncbi:MAG TPA: DUF167 domain-containing protein [Fibrobacteraceae bacterium]|nr:DUF167 domain-containing protein [Fibrobacteraceae bacterium]